MAKASPGIAAFNSGELSPACEGRTDLKQYATGAFRMENFIPMVQGPARRRPGTRFVAEVKNSASPTALMEFVKSVQVAFMLEWGDHYVRFYQNYQRVTVAGFGLTWNPTVGGTTADGTVTWTNKGAAVWQALTNYAQNSLIIDSNGNIQIQTWGVPFTPSGASRPDWKTTVGAFTQDGALIWVCLGAPLWQAATPYAVGSPYPTVIFDTNGNIEQVTVAGTSSAGVQIPYEIASPYAASDLFDSNGFFMLVYIQSADVIYIAHRSKTFPIYKLSHFGTTNWTLKPLGFFGGPFAEPNPGTNPCVYASGQSGIVTLTASANIFDPLLIGSYFQLTQNNIRTIRGWAPGHDVKKGSRHRNNGVTYEALNGTNLNLSSPAPVTGTVPPTHLSGEAWDGVGHHTGILWLYRDAGFGFVQITGVGAKPAGAATPITGITAAKPPVVTLQSAPPFAEGAIVFITGVQGMTEVNDAFYAATNVAGNTFQLYQDDTNGDGDAGPVDGLLWDAYAGGGTADNRLWTATGNVVTQENAIGTINRLPQAVTDYPNATPIWAFARFNVRDGWPNAVSFFDGRLCMGRDGDVELSVSADFENFSALTPGGLVTADQAISVTLPTQDELEWLIEGRVLVVGTQAAEHVVQNINSAQPLAPSNIASKAQMRHGSRRIRPALIGYSLLWAQTSGQKMRIMKYQFFTDQYQSEDLAALANHIFEKHGPVALAYQQEPDSVIWMIRNGGNGVLP